MLQYTQADRFAEFSASFDHMVAKYRMLLHDSKFFLIQPARLVQNFQRDLRLADIVQKPGYTDFIDFLFG